ncbi:MAG TPA: type II toxin-antitoxin system VapC family toxin [Chthoniobacterales bacterium]
MKLLLDTQVLIWSLAADRRLKSTARRAIEDGSNRVWVSAASAWEIEIKTALGKLQVPGDLLTQMTAVKFDELAIRIEHALYLRHLPALHRDPFDRIIIAQALCEGLTLVTTDPIMRGYPVRTIRAD